MTNGQVSGVSIGWTRYLTASLDRDLIPIPPERRTYVNCTQTICVESF
jgi:hypothetical protein